MNGLEAADHLRQILPSLLLLLFTNYWSAHLAAAAGITKVVSKDTSIARLKAAIERLLQSQSSNLDPAVPPQGAQAS